MIFEAVNETREEIWSDFGAEKKWRAEQKKSGFVFRPLFLRRREIDVKKFFQSEWNFFVHVRLLEAFFFYNFRWLWGLIMILY